jgi:hypothetical protein
MKREITLIIVLMGSLAVMGQWSNNPENNLFVNGYLRSNLPGYWGEKVQTAPNGHTYLLFLSSTRLPSLSLVDRKGYAAWNPGIVYLSGSQAGSCWTGLVCDPEGNAIAGLEKGRWIDQEHYQKYISIHKISSTGESMWGVNGIEFSDPDHDLVGSGMSLCNDGSILLICQPQEDTSNVYPHSVSVRKIHRILPDGTLAWGLNGLTFREHGWTELYPLEDGTFFRLWYVLESKAPNQRYSVWTNYYDRSGQPVWPKDLKIYNNQKDNYPAPAGVLNNTLYISYYPYSIQAIHPAGSELYAAGGEPVFGNRFGSCASIESIGKDPKGNLMFSVVFQMNAIVTHRIHKMSPSGELLWGQDGKEFLPSRYTGAPVHYRLDSTGNLYVFYRDPTAMGRWPEKNSQFWVDGFDTNGNKLVGFPVMIASQKRVRSPGYAGEVKNGQMIYLWEEKVPDINLTFFAAQNVSIDGTLGIRSTGIEGAGYPCDKAYIGYDFKSRIVVMQPSDESRKIRLISLTGSTVMEVVTTGNPFVPENLQGLFILEIQGSLTPPERHKILIF